MKSSTKGNTVITDFLEYGTIASMKKLVEYCRTEALCEIQIANLAKGLANSGHVFLKSDVIRYDVPSTGGPGSLSTLLTPLILAATGKKVVKLGVPGRPAGGIDVLAQIKNYNISPDKGLIDDWLSKFAYIHIVANNVFAPLDRKFFHYRKANGAVDIPELVVASILSKKIASGVRVVGLDIRVSSFGNFGRTWENARGNANLFNRVSSTLDIQSKCFLSNGFTPPQPYIGRGESLLALYNIFNQKNIEFHLKKHLEYCFSMASSLSDGTGVLSVAALEKVFNTNVQDQGGDLDSFFEIASTTENAHVYEIKAKESGFLIIDNEGIRNAIISVQAKNKKSEFADPCGVILRAYQNQYIRESEVICSFRCEKDYKEEFVKFLMKSFTYSPVINLKEELEVI